jgi:hypothetical protein
MAAGVLAVPLLQVAVTDLRHRYVYTVIAGAGIVLGIGLGWLVHGGEWWFGALGAAGGVYRVPGDLYHRAAGISGARGAAGAR